MKSNKILMIIVSLCLIIVVGSLVILMNKNKGITINKSINIEVGGYNQVLKVDKVYYNYVTNNDKYVKLDIEIDNKKNVESMTSLHRFILLDSNNNEIVDCYHAGILPDSNISGIFPNVIKASGNTVGSLYCPTTEKDIKKLEVVVISGGKLDENMQATYEYEKYDIELK